MRSALSKDVIKAIESNDVKHMNNVIENAVKKLKQTVFLYINSTNECDIQKYPKRSMSKEYDEAILALTKCITEIRKKISLIG